MATDVVEKTEKTVYLICDRCLEPYEVAAQDDWILDVLESAEHVDCPPSAEGPGRLVRRVRRKVRFDLIDDNPYQPRQTYDDDYIISLADSIEQIGVLQTPLARFTDLERFQLAFGHQRVLACIYLMANREGPEEIEIDVAALSEEDMAIIALTENVARRQLTSIEVIRAQRRAIDETALTVTQLAEQLGRDPSTISNNLRILELPDSILQHVESGDLAPSVAREFLALQCTGDHVHDDDIQTVLRRITNSSPPDWRRRAVRQLISEAVSYNEKDWRPLGAPTSSSTGGGTKVAGFDTDAFKVEFPKSLHTIPATTATNVWGGQDPAWEKSRVWTCEAREWSRWQSRATREANRAAEADAGDGVSRENSGRSAPKPNKNQDFERTLGKDPVFLKIKKGRQTEKGKQGPNRPVSEEEKEALGTRAELRNLDPYGDKEFWRHLENDVPENVRGWGSHRAGSKVPPFFNLAECRGCTAGRAYGKVHGNYHYSTGRDGILPVCLNRQCYDAKLSRDTAAHQDEVEAQLVAQNREDDQLVRTIMAGLTTLSATDLRTVAVSLVAAQPVLDLHHALGGIPHQKWSYKTQVLMHITKELNHQPASFESYQPLANGKVRVKVDSLDDVGDEEMLELVACLMVHHLRIAGKVDVGAQLPIP